MRGLLGEYKHRDFQYDPKNVNRDIVSAYLWIPTIVTTL